MSDTLKQRISQHQFLADLRSRLTHLHQQLLTTERLAYERVSGQVPRQQLLQLALTHDQFAWLRQLSRLIVAIDLQLQSDEPCSDDTVAEVVTAVRTLLTPNQLGNDFAARYDAALQQSPDVVLAHADVVQLLPLPPQP